MSLDWGLFTEYGGRMLSLTLAIIASTAPVNAAPVDDCVEAATSWIAGIQTEQCPPLFRYENAAVDACRAMPDDGWTRSTKSARKALLRDCAPSDAGFPGAKAKLNDGRTLSHCSELILMMRGLAADDAPPTETTMGVDGMAVSVGAALFACTTPEAIAKCRMPFSLYTDTARLEEQVLACDSVEPPAFDTVMRSLVWGSGLLPVEPEKRASQIRDVLAEKARLTALKEKALADFKAAREEEVGRAQTLSDACMTIPGEMTLPTEADAAIAACDELLALWRGEDSVRRELESSGTLAEDYQKRLKGKVLNAASLHVADEARVTARPETLKVRRVALIASHFETLIATDVAAAEAWIDTYRDDMDPEWVADALDQVLAATM